MVVYASYCNNKLCLYNDKCPRYMLCAPVDCTVVVDNLKYSSWCKKFLVKINKNA